ncbi:hypothetical protein OHR86_28150 [Streptomyces sp. NBC_00441]|uniref:hypothetical protein n=1 Tax=Streptomyces sp. NBC_00441 TaxID=2975742 RepID=UPI002E2B7ED8|nr:hypothetical protein [Streptomyces sp. NBC_00441]
MTAMDLYVVAYVIAGPVATTADTKHIAEVDAADNAQQAATNELAADVRRALGLRSSHILDGETATSVNVWSQHELNAIYAKVGGVVTTRTVQRSWSGGTFPAVEITVTATLPGIGTIQIATDWDEDSGGHNLPVMRDITALAAA